VTQNTRPHLVELRLKALTAQVSVASQAHIAIHQSANSPVGDEVRDLFTKIETLSRFALASSKFNFSGTTGDYREEIDIVLQQADRLLQWDRESASRVLRLHTVDTSGVSGTFNNVETIEIHGHLAALE
jgi:D-mannonate dehydratase